MFVVKKNLFINIILRIRPVSTKLPSSRNWQIGKINFQMNKNFIAQESWKQIYYYIQIIFPFYIMLLIYYNLYFYLFFIYSVVAELNIINRILFVILNKGSIQDYHYAGYKLYQRYRLQFIPI